MRKRLIDLLPLVVMAFFSIEMILFVVFVLKLPYLLVAYIPLVSCIFILIILYLRKKEVD